MTIPAATLAEEILAEIPRPEYMVDRDVPIFTVHTIPGDVRRDATGKPIVGPDGQPQREPPFVVDAKILHYIAANCNRRYARGEASPIVVGHTIDGAPERDQPEVIGVVGSDKGRPAFRIVNHNGQPTIVCDFWIRKDDVIKRQKNPRVSVELWSEGPPQQWFIDPISCLGAKTPALQLGTRYERQPGGRLVRKYSALMQPSATSVQIPGSGADSKRKNYEAPMADAPPVGQAPVSQPAAPSGPTIGEADMQALAAAVARSIEMTPEWQFIKQQMQSAQGANAEPMADPAAPAGAPSAANDPPGAPPAPAATAPPPAPVDPLADADEYTRGRYQKMAQYMAEDARERASGFMDALDDDGRMKLSRCMGKNAEMKSYYALSDEAPASPGGDTQPPTTEAPQMANPTKPGNYAADAATVRRYEAERAADKKKIEALEQQVGELVNETRRVKRYEKLGALVQEGVILENIDEEFETTKTLDDAGFEKHLERARKLYARKPAATGLWTGPDAAAPVRQAPQAADQQFYGRAHQLASEKGLSWDAAKAAALKERSGS